MPGLRTGCGGRRERDIGDGELANKRGEVGERGLALLYIKKLIILVPVHERLGVKRNVREIWQAWPLARDRFGDAVCLVAEDECEQVVASFAAAVAALVDEDAELLGQWGLLMNK